MTTFKEAYLSLYIVNSTAGGIGVGPIVGFIYFLNASINFILYLHQKKRFRPSKILLKVTSVKATTTIPK